MSTKFSQTFSSSTATLPIVWRRDEVCRVKINLELYEILATRSWHLTSMSEARAPRTSFSLDGKNYNLWLHRIVVALSIEEDFKAANELFSNRSELVRITTRLPQLAFANGKPFDCRVENLLLKYQNVKVNDVEFTSAQLELPASALIERRKKPLSRAEVEEPNLQEEVENQVEHRRYVKEEEDSNHQAINDVFDILGLKDSEGVREEGVQEGTETDKPE